MQPVNGLFTLTRQSGNDDITLDHAIDIVAKIRQILNPVQPSSEFRLRLKNELLLNAYRKQAKPAAPSRQLMLFTAVGFVVSVAGYLFARRYSNQMPPLTMPLSH